VVVKKSEEVDLLSAIDQFLDEGVMMLEQATDISPPPKDAKNKKKVKEEKQKKKKETKTVKKSKKVTTETKIKVNSMKVFLVEYYNCETLGFRSWRSD